MRHFIYVLVNVLQYINLHYRTYILFYFVFVKLFPTFEKEKNTMMKHELNKFLIELKNNPASSGTPIHGDNSGLVEELRLCKWNLIAVRGGRIFLSEVAERNFEYILQFDGSPSEYTPPYAEAMLKSLPLTLSTSVDSSNAR